MLPKLYGDKITQELDVTGELAQLIESASNRDKGLPSPIEIEFENLESKKNLVSFASNENTHSIEGQVPDHEDTPPVCVGAVSETNYLRGFKTSSSTPSNHRRIHRHRRKIEIEE